MNDPLRTLAFNKRICTGISMDYDSPPGANHRMNQNAFDALVSEYYKLFRESISRDVAFLRSIQDHRVVADFDDCIYRLRTAKQHKDNRQAVAFYSEWTAARQPWQRAAESLVDAFATAIRHLEVVSNRVRRDPSLSIAWKEHASVDPELVFEGVCRDLRARFPEGRRRALVQNVRRRLKYLKPGDDVRAAAEEYCAQEITAQTSPLPVPYFEVLDRLDLIGKPEARAALMVAYSIRASTHLRGEQFLLRVEEAWKVASS